MLNPTESIWFDVAIVCFIFAIGNIIFGHFEERTPMLRRVAKFLLTLVLIGSLSYFFGRAVAMISLSLLLLPVLYIHGFYLPSKKGINGWTGEPKSKYYDFRGWNKNIFNK